MVSNESVSSTKGLLQKFDTLIDRLRRKSEIKEGGPVDVFSACRIQGCKVD
ncbi:hypothetical protein SAMN05421730_100794 [Anaerobium acetethylicum]|uniref:Uncharacterized protein n=1 Tax=Anaerobium acetethylicum TaxID=1619234 RepID=A0A1D3TSX1_9FIRM|nr:hypothetical protein SAMN05421730_100794 [Anaerobium acetethylicum]